MLSRSIASEYSDKLDVIIATVGPTKSNMSPGLATLSSYPNSVVSHTLRQLGKETYTYGDFRHGLRDYLLNSMITESITRWNDSRNIATALRNK